MKDRNEAERTKQQRKQAQKVTRILQKDIFFRNSYPREQKISNSKRKEQREESVRKDNREKTSVQREKKAGQTDDRGKKKKRRSSERRKEGDTCSRGTHVAGRRAGSVGKVALLLPSGLPTRPLLRPLAFPKFRARIP